MRGAITPHTSTSWHFTFTFIPHKRGEFPILFRNIAVKSGYNSMIKELPSAIFTYLSEQIIPRFYGT
jgi:hypothetical protein